MAQSVCVVRASLTATNGASTDFTKSGFGTPSAAIIIAGEANTTANPAQQARISIGFWDGSTERVVGIFSQDGVTTMNSLRGAVQAGVLMTSGGTINSQYGVSTITDGIRLTMEVDNTSLSRHCTVVMFSGISAKAGVLTMNTTQNATTESASLGFAPALVLCASVGMAADEDDTDENATLSFGFATSSAQRMIAFGSLYGVGNEIANMLFSETRCAGVVLADTNTWNGEITTFGLDTFTITTRDGSAGSHRLYFLALGGGDLSFDVGTLSTRTTAGTDQVSTAINPDAILVALSTATGTSLETGSGANGFMVGAADDNGQYAHNISVCDALAAANSNSASQNDRLIDLDTSVGTTRTELVDATIVFNTTNFEITYSLADATARKGWWLAMAGQSLTYTQEAYRWRYDDGDEDGATFSTYQDESGSASIGVTKRLRVIVNVAGNPGSPAGKQFELQYRKAGSPTDEWKTVH
jgi:hypothetical protein